MVKNIRSLVEILIARGYSVDRASDTLTNIVLESISELYSEKYPDRDSADRAEVKLNQLFANNAGKKMIMDELGIDPADLNKRIRDKFINLMEKE